MKKTLEQFSTEQLQKEIKQRTGDPENIATQIVDEAHNNATAENPSLLDVYKQVQELDFEEITVPVPNSNFSLIVTLRMDYMDFFVDDDVLLKITDPKKATPLESTLEAQLGGDEGFLYYPRLESELHHLVHDQITPYRELVNKMKDRIDTLATERGIKPCYVYDVLQADLQEYEGE